MKNKLSLNDFFKDHQYTLLVLSIFLLITIEFVGKEGYLNNLLALLSASITYFLLIGVDIPINKDKESFPLFGFSIIFPLFIITFCSWTILNIVTTLDDGLGKISWIITWLILMIYPGIRFWIRKN